MLPVIALVGRPNVGKSTLFNRLTKSQDALVIDIPGVTRDRIYGRAQFNDQPFILIDTGGLAGDEQGIDQKMADQSQAAIAEADAILLLTDARAGCLAGDIALANQLRASDKPVFLVVNKIDGICPDTALGDFYQLGLDTPIPLAAAHNRGVNPLLNQIFAKISLTPTAESTNQGSKVAIVGKPNVGKSTLVNRLLGEERVVVYDQPGTTRDSIAIEITHFDKPYVLIDTAGVRKRGKVKAVIEKFSVIKTLKAVDEADVVIFMIDAQQGVSEHDLHLLGFILDQGRSLIIAINKWDGLTDRDKNQIKAQLDRRLGFVDFALWHTISALHGTNVGHLWPAIDKAHRSAYCQVSTHRLTALLAQAVSAHQPPLNRGRRIKLRYAHLGGNAPPTIVIHGNQLDYLSDSYLRYLSNFFRQALHLVATPVRIITKTSDNPFAGQPNRLSKRQLQKRKRLLKHVKKQKK